MGQIDMPAYCEILQDELQRVKQENERLVKQNQSLQQDCKMIAICYLNALKVVDKMIEKGYYAKVD